MKNGTTVHVPAVAGLAASTHCSLSQHHDFLCGVDERWKFALGRVGRLDSEQSEGACLGQSWAVVLRPSPVEFSSKQAGSHVN